MLFLQLHFIMKVFLFDINPKTILHNRLSNKIDYSLQLLYDIRINLFEKSIVATYYRKKSRMERLILPTRKTLKQTIDAILR